MCISRLGTPHSQATARSALRAVADLAGVRAGLNRYSTAWGNTCWTVTRQCLAEARRVGSADARMVDDVLALPRLRGPSGRLGRDLADAEVAALLVVVASDSVRNRRDGCLLALLAFGGLRRSECISVAVRDRDPATRVLTVRLGKGRKVRSVTLPATAAGLIDRWLQVHPGADSLLRGVDRWEHITDGALTSAAVPKILECLCRRADVVPVSADAFRARRITQVISAADPLIAQRFARHSSSATTAVYDRRGTDATVVIDRLEAAQSGRESDQSSVQASTVWAPSAIRNTATCPNSAPIALAS